MPLVSVPICDCKRCVQVNRFVCQGDHPFRCRATGITRASFVLETPHNQHQDILQHRIDLTRNFLRKMKLFVHGLVVIGAVLLIAKPVVAPKSPCPDGCLHTCTEPDKMTKQCEFDYTYYQCYTHGSDIHSPQYPVACEIVNGCATCHYAQEIHG